MRTKTTGAWFLPLHLSCISLPVCGGQSQIPQKVAQDNSAARSIFHVGGDVTAPKAIYAPEPEFSEASRRAGYGGTCVLSVIVGSDGRPRDIRVVRKLGMQLDEQAIQALREWRFEAAQKAGKPVASLIDVEFSFHFGGSKQMFSAEQLEQMRLARSRIQSQIYRIPADKAPLVCSSSSDHGTAAVIAELILQGDLRMPIVGRDRIAVSIKQRTYSGSEDQIASEISENVQRAWQNARYSAAQDCRYRMQKHVC
jgi:TonB family protein